MRKTPRQYPSVKTETGECLLRHVNSEANSGSPSFKDGEPVWEASTLPLSYTRQVKPVEFYVKTGQKTSQRAVFPAALKQNYPLLNHYTNVTIRLFTLTLAGTL
jgi:hypothetical protein